MSLFRVILCFSSVSGRELSLQKLASAAARLRKYVKDSQPAGSVDEKVDEDDRSWPQVWEEMEEEVRNRRFRKRWRWPQILQFCGDDRRLRRMHVLIRPRLSPYMSIVPTKLQDLRPSPSFTKLSMCWATIGLALDTQACCRCSQAWFFLPFGVSLSTGKIFNLYWFNCQVGRACFGESNPDYFFVLL